MTAPARKIIACDVMRDELEAAGLPAGCAVEYVEIGNHLVPDKFRGMVQEIIDSSHGFERIILAFGLCGGIARDLHSATSVLTIPRVHDCVSLFLCDDSRPPWTFAKRPGVFYLTKGWMALEQSIISEFERLQSRYGPKKAAALYSRIYDGYHKVLYIRTGAPGEDELIPSSQRIAELLQSGHETRDIRSGIFARIANGPWDDECFINVAPGACINEDDFWFPDEAEQPGAQPGPAQPGPEQTRKEAPR
jgi:hypothetical protein